MWLLLFTFFTGIFNSFFFNISYSEFIIDFGTSIVPYSYLASGVIGLITVRIYTYFQTRTTLKNLFLYTLIAIFVVMLMFYFASLVLPNESRAKYVLTFLMFSFVPPSLVLTALIFNSLALRFFNLRQGKRLYALVNSGEIIGSIISFFSIPSIIRLGVKGHHFLLIGAIGLGLAIFVLYFLSKKYHDQLLFRPQKKEKGQQTKLLPFLRMKYFGLISLLFTLSVVGAYFTNFGYIGGTKLMHGIIPIAEFVALFSGISKIGEFIISLISSRLLNKYGIKLGIAIMPVSLGIFMILLLITTFFAADDRFYLFIFLVITRFVDRIFRQPIEASAFKILYEPMDSVKKLTTQTMVGGNVRQIATVFSGGVLILLNYIITYTHADQELVLKYFSVFFFILTAAWIFVSFKLYAAYKVQINDYLAERSKKKVINHGKYIYGLDIISYYLDSPDLNVVKDSTILVATVNPYQLEHKLEKLFAKNDNLIKKLILENVDPTTSREAANIIKRQHEHAPDEIKELSSNAINYLDVNYIGMFNKEKLIKLSNSPALDDKMQLIKYLVENRSFLNSKYLLILIDDNEPMVKRAAIHLAARYHSPELLSRLVLMLENDDYYVCRHVIESYGDAALSELEHFISKASSSVAILRIAEICARINTPASLKFLANYITYPGREVQLTIINALCYCDFQAKGENTLKIKNLIEDSIKHILWLYSSMVDVKNEKHTARLFQSLERELIETFEVLFNLLSFVYNSTSIELIKENYEGDENVFAIEIIENFIHDETKQMLIPLIEKSKITSKLKQLKDVYPQQKMELSERLCEIINRDYNTIDIQTKVRAIELLGKLETKKVPIEVKACLYHPNEFIHTAAARVCYAIEPENCFEYFQNSQWITPDIMDTLKSGNEKNNTVLSKVKALRRLAAFFSLSERYLIKLAQIIDIIEVAVNEKITLFDHKLDYILIIQSGKLCAANDDSKTVFSKNDVIIRGINTDDTAEYLVASEHAVVFRAIKNKYFTILIDDIKKPNLIFNTKVFD